MDARGALTKFICFTAGNARNALDGGHVDADGTQEGVVERKLIGLNLSATATKRERSMLRDVSPSTQGGSIEVAAMNSP